MKYTSYFPINLTLHDYRLPSAKQVPTKSEKHSANHATQKLRNTYFYDHQIKIKPTNARKGLSASLVQACSLGRYRREFKSLQPHQIDVFKASAILVWCRLQ